MRLANCSLIASLALQTRQMKFAWLVSNRMICSSPRPISRRRFWVSGAAQSCLMRTAMPALTLLRGHGSHRDSLRLLISLIFTGQVSRQTGPGTTRILRFAGHVLSTTQALTRALSINAFFDLHQSPGAGSCHNGHMTEKPLMDPMKEKVVSLAE